jgi:hypothetical protein
VNEPLSADEGAARLQEVLAETRRNAERALRELHHAMSRDLRRAERRAARAERRVAELRERLRKTRRKATRLERRLAKAQAARTSPGLRQTLGRVRRKLSR